MRLFRRRLGMKKIVLFVLGCALALTACVFRGFKQSDVIDIKGNVYVITMAIEPIDGVDSIEKRPVSNPDSLDGLGISRDMINNKGRSDAELEDIPKGLDIPDVNRDFMGFIAFKDKYFPTLPARQPGGVGQAVMILKGKIGVVSARTTSFEVRKGETIEIPILVTSYTANLFEISYPIVGNGACRSYADVLPSFGNIAGGATIQLQLVGNRVGQYSTTLYVTLYNSPPQHSYEAWEIPITITVTE